MSTNIVAFLLLTKHRKVSSLVCPTLMAPPITFLPLTLRCYMLAFQGVKLPELVSSYEWITDKISSYGRYCLRDQLVGVLVTGNGGGKSVNYLSLGIQLNQCSGLKLALILLYSCSIPLVNHVCYTRTVGEVEHCTLSHCPIEIPEMD